MAVDSFEKTNWGWQMSQFQQQVGEWVELQFSRFDAALPKVSPPTWLLNNPWWELLKVVAWVVLVGLLSIWGVQLWRRFSPAVYAFLANNRNSYNAASSRRVSEFTVKELLERSQQFYSRGNHREACRCLYLAMLQRLHDTNIALHKPSRTDGEYRQLLQPLSKSQSYQTLIGTHEQLCFGNGDIAQETFEQCRQAYRQIEGEK